MPKKGKVDPDAEPEVPLDEEGNPIDDVAINIVEDALCEELIPVLLDEAIVAIHDERIAEITVPFAASLALNNTVRVAAWSDLGRDFGSQEAQDEDSLLWSIEAEPSPSRVDAWARGSVPTKAKKKTETFSSIEHMKGSVSPGAMSVNSRSSRGKFSHRTGSRGGKRPHGMSPNDFTPIVVSIDLDQEDAMTDGKLRGVKSDAGTLMDGKGQGDAELLRALKVDKEKKMAEIRKQKEKEMADNAENVAHETLMKQLNGKDYTIDDDGSVILVEVPDSKALPPPTGFKVDSSVFDVMEEESSPGGRRTPNSRRGKRGKKKPGSSQKKKRGDQSFFTVSSTAQPALVSTMTISAGVSLKEGRRGKSGPEVTGGPGKMSKREYDDRKRREEESYYASIGGSTYAGDSIDLDSQTVSTNESLTLDGTEAMSPRPESEPKVFLGEVDSLAGAKKAKRKVETPEHVKESAHDKLIQDPNWGKPNLGNDPSPIRLSSKPGAKQREIVSQFSGGPNAKNRRDRMQPSAMVPNKDRKHLPAPPLGHATGHGMTATIASGTKSVEFDDGFSVSSRSQSSRVQRSKAGNGMFPPIVKAEGVDDASVSGSVASKKAAWKRNRQESILGTKGGGIIRDGDNPSLKEAIMS